MASPSAQGRPTRRGQRAAAAAMACTQSGVLAFSEPHVLGAALVQDEYGLPGPSLRAAVTSRNKALQGGGSPRGHRPA